MSSDAPNAGIELTDVWTAERVRAVDDLWADSPLIALTSIAVDEATGQAVGFTIGRNFRRRVRGVAGTADSLVVAPLANGAGLTLSGTW